MFNSKAYNTLLFNDTSLYFGSVLLNGTSNISILANLILQAHTSLTGQGNIEIYVVKRQFSSTNFAGISNIQVIPLKILYGNSLLEGIGNLTVNALKILFATLQMNGIGNLSGKAIAASFIITSDNILQPLNVQVLRDSREDLLPGIREFTEEIPGRHGEIDFGSEFQPRILELHVISVDDLNISLREQIKRDIAKYLDPTKGVKTLIFANDDTKTYNVKYAGRIDLKQYPTRLEFTIPFKCSDPFIMATYEKNHTGSGILTNEGTFETPVVITIKGPVTNPSVKIGNNTLTYTGTLSSTDTLIINTETMTVTFNGVNALANYSGSFPKLPPGNTEVVAASSGTTIFTWRDRWI
jgi:predicted phage tail component-like protein